MSSALLFRSIVIVGFTVTAVAGQQAPARDAAVPVVARGTATLGGVVRDAANRPLRRALVSIAGDMRLSLATITDDEGRFSFDDLPAGRFTITGTKAGYLPMSYGATRPFRPGSGVLLAEGQRKDDITLSLARGAVLSGTVFDDKGQPMPEVPVMAYEVRTSLAGERVFDMPATGGESVRTDDRGMYRIYGLPPGDYTVGTAWFFHGSEQGSVRVLTDAEIRAAFQLANQPGAPGRPPGTAASATSSSPASETRFDYAPVYHPDRVDALTATVMSMKAGEERDGIDIRMQFRAMSRIEGTVRGPDGPVASARMILMRRSRVRASNTTTFWLGRPDGSFVTSSVPPGEYTVMAEVRGGPTEPVQWASADVTVTGSEPVTVALTLQPSMTASGRVIFEGTTLSPPDLSRVRISFAAAEGANSRIDTTPSPIDPAGNFTIGGLAPGKFRVTATAPGAAKPGAPAWTVRSVVIDGRDVTDLPIDVPPGRPPSLTVTFTDLMSELSGTIAAPAGQAASDFFVIVFPADRQYWDASRRIASVRPDASGRFVFRNLPAGDYRIAATTDLVPRDLQDTAALARLAGQSAPLTIAAGEKKTFDFRIGG